ncbi:MAG: hypothetical protein KatS3mg052_1911 [Candidatus Roseilinea sp.]|nr:MAG: hypothetical protein KatS3mg052_1911 [Candidatus Roseilinea sp.]
MRLATRLVINMLLAGLAARLNERAAGTPIVACCEMAHRGQSHGERAAATADVR